MVLVVGCESVSLVMFRTTLEHERCAPSCSLLVSTRIGIQLDVQHISGERNVEADLHAGIRRVDLRVSKTGDLNIAP